MQESSGTVRMAQIVQEGEALQGIYLQASESASAGALKRHILDMQLIEIENQKKADGGKLSIEAATRVAKIQAEINRLNAQERSDQIAYMKSIGEMYKAFGADRRALIVEEGALTLEIAEAKARADADGNAAAQAELNRLFTQLVEIKKQQAELAKETASRLGGEPAGNLIGIGATAEIFAAGLDSGILVDTSDQISFLSTQAKGAMEDLKELGGDGPLIASIMQGAFNVSEAWAIAAESLSVSAETWQQKMVQAASVAQAVGATISAIGSIQAAASDQRVAALESEIAAEKKRDGVTKESKAKIAALEAKAEKEKRKAFERDKKAKMAATVMNTAASIMSSMAAPWPSNFIFAAMAAVMGAAQLAAIASTSYQGGASSAPQGPTALSLGERTSTIDLATSKSASGELGYMRGESGIGGIGEFKPAFTGAKYRATGGATAGYIVGEQGPELFVPQTPGTIIPNEEVEQTPMQNINFTIQAVDADGVETLLMKQKGSIIRMIREAANSYGTPFLEEVNVGLYTPKAQGAGRA